MEKFRNPLTKYEKEKLDELSRKDFSDWNESEIREYFLVPLLNLLGYNKSSDYDVSNESIYDLNPLFLQPGNKNRRIKLDYICSVRKTKFWIIEAKKGYKNRKGNPSLIEEENIDQAYFYSLHPAINCPYFLVSNGWHTNLYKRDEIGEDLKSTLSISCETLVDRFLELDSYIGSTQILPHIKGEILSDIKNVLSSEVHLDRLDEFNEEVENVVNSVRPIVFENYKQNLEIEEKKGQENLIKFMNQETLQFLPSSVFNNINSIGETKNQSRIILERFGKSNCRERYNFLYNLLLDEIRPVTIEYYLNVLVFLIEFYKRNYAHIPSPHRNSKDILIYWIELLLFGFEKNKILRYLWAFEGLVHRLTTRLLIFPLESRRNIDSLLKYELYKLPEEKVAWLKPNPAVKIIKILKYHTFQTLSEVLFRYYKKGEFKENLCYQEYNKFKRIVEKIEHDTNKDYWDFKNELGIEWGTIRPYEFTNHYNDIISSGACHILRSEPKILKLLPKTLQERIEIIASIRIDHGPFKKIVNNFAEECCQILNITPREVKISSKKIEVYFDPKENPYSFRI